MSKCPGYCHPLAHCLLWVPYPNATYSSKGDPFADRIQDAVDAVSTMEFVDEDCEVDPTVDSDGVH
jgi:hypothetical protein